MFLRPHSRIKDGKRHSYWSLVETVRTPDGPATADPLLSGRAERFGAGTLAEDDRGFQSTGRKQAAEAIPLRGASTGKRSRCGAGAVEQSAAGKDTAVGTVLPGLGTVAASETG